MSGNLRGGAIDLVVERDIDPARIPEHVAQRVRKGEQFLERIGMHAGTTATERFSFQIDGTERVVYGETLGNGIVSTVKTVDIENARPGHRPYVAKHIYLDLPVITKLERARELEHLLRAPETPAAFLTRTKLAALLGFAPSAVTIDDVRHARRSLESEIDVMVIQQAARPQWLSQHRTVRDLLAPIVGHDATHPIEEVVKTDPDTRATTRVSAIRPAYTVYQERDPYLLTTLLREHQAALVGRDAPRNAPSSLAQLIYTLADTLARLSRAGFVDSDIKPDNLSARYVASDRGEAWHVRFIDIGEFKYHGHMRIEESELLNQTLNSNTRALDTLGGFSIKYGANRVLREYHAAFAGKRDVSPEHGSAHPTDMISAFGVILLETLYGTLNLAELAPISRWDEIPERRAAHVAATRTSAPIHPAFAPYAPIVARAMNENAIAVGAYNFDRLMSDLAEATAHVFTVAPPRNEQIYAPNREFIETAMRRPPRF